jgi:hypothetical protein
MMLMVEEQPQLSTSLLTRSTPSCWGKPILPLSIGLKPLPLRPVSRKGNIPLPALKRKQSKPPADYVMTQIELPPYHGPQSPLDLVVVGIILV